MAEGALRARLAAARLDDRVEVDSAGTGDWHAGEPPDPRTVAMAARFGIDVSGLRARQVVPADFTHFDWILCADAANLRDVRALAPADATARDALLREWAGQGVGATIADPYTGGDTEFEAVWRQVDAAAVAVVERLGRRGTGLPA